MNELRDVCQTLMAKSNQKMKSYQIRYACNRCGNVLSPWVTRQGEILAICRICGTPRTIGIANQHIVNYFK